MTGKTIYTVGTSTRSIGEFIELLKSRGVQSAIDVRRFPSSRFDHFRLAKLSETLNEAGINYVYLGEQLGGYRQGGFQNFTTTADFHAGLQKLERIAQEGRAVIFCAEKFPWRCHRRFIASELEQRGWQIIHIIDRERDWISSGHLNDRQ